VTLADILAIAMSHVNQALSTPTGIVALAAAVVGAALSVIGTFLKTMIPLRWLAVGTNAGFVVYGALFPNLPMLILHATLLPINIFRAMEMTKLTRRVTRAAKSGDMSGIWLKPYMKKRQLKAGTILFRKGDTADHLYLLADGLIEFVEIGTQLKPGRIFGEIAFFAPDRRRTLTARCVENCTVLSIVESTVKQLYYQSPEFGFEVVALVAGRLTADIDRLRKQLEVSVGG